MVIIYTGVFVVHLPCHGFGVVTGPRGPKVMVAIRPPPTRGTAWNGQEVVESREYMAIVFRDVVLPHPCK